MVGFQVVWSENKGVGESCANFPSQPHHEAPHSAVDDQYIEGVYDVV